MSCTDLSVRSERVLRRPIRSTGSRVANILSCLAGAWGSLPSWPAAAAARGLLPALAAFSRPMVTHLGGCG